MKKKALKEYQEYLKKKAKSFRLTAEDLSNLTDLGMMIPNWLIECVLKPNKMDKWFFSFFNSIEDITLKDIKHKSPQTKTYGVANPVIGDITSLSAIDLGIGSNLNVESSGRDKTGDTHKGKGKVIEHIVTQEAVDEMNALSKKLGLPKTKLKVGEKFTILLK